MSACVIEGCESDVTARGWCRKHYMRWSRHGDPLGVKPKPPRKTCQVEGCSEAHKCKGMCGKHYDAWRHENRPQDEESIRARSQRKREQYAKHRTSILAYMKDYYTENSVRMKANSSRRRSGMSRAEINAEQRAWYESNLERNRARSRMGRQARRTREAQQPVFDIAPKDLRRLFASPCVYCGARSQVTLDHVIPVSRGGSFGIGNIAPACESCNKSKCDRLPVEYRVWKLKKEIA